MPSLDTPYQMARKLSQELGQPGVRALQLAAKKAGIPVTKAEVEQIVKQQGEKQVFGPLQGAKGKTVSRGVDDSWQMDLADLKNQPGTKAKKGQGSRLQVLPRGYQHLRSGGIHAGAEDEGALGGEDEAEPNPARGPGKAQGDLLGQRQRVPG